MSQETNTTEQHIENPESESHLLDRLVRLCNMGEELGRLQPNLWFKNDNGKWVKSGIVRGRLGHGFEGRYGVFEPNAKDDQCR